jgi:hypothetical protein
MAVYRLNPRIAFLSPNPIALSTGINSIFLKTAVFLCLLFIWCGGSPVFAEAQAVLVCGRVHNPEALAEPGKKLRNTGKKPLFLLLSTGRLERVKPGASYKIPEGLAPRAWFFSPVSAALEDFHEKSSRLKTILDKNFPGSEPEDTVEGTLVYPLGATVVESPEAFKWHTEGRREVNFELCEENGGETLFKKNLRVDRLNSEEFGHLLRPGRLYRWSVGTVQRADTAWFALLEVEKMIPLSEQLAVLDRLESLDPDNGNSYGWLVLKTAVLCRLGLSYEARAQILARINNQGTARHAPTGADENLYNLLRQVRKLQRYGHLLRARD